MNQNISLKKEKFYCKYCKENPTIEIPHSVDLSSPSSEGFVRNLKCTICKTIGDIRRWHPHLLSLLKKLLHLKDHLLFFDETIVCVLVYQIARKYCIQHSQERYFVNVGKINHMKQGWDISFRCNGHYPPYP